MTAPYLSLADACAATGMGKRTMYRHLKAGAFCASLPNGPRGGWRIVRPSFEQWWNARMGATSNRSAATLSKKQK